MREAKEILLKNLLQGGGTLGVIGRRVYDACSYAIKEALTHSVNNWVTISRTEQLEVMTDVIVKYKDGRKEVAFYDGDRRFYIKKDDRDVTETIVEWQKLP